METKSFNIFTGDTKTMLLKALYAESLDPLDLTACDEIVVFLPNADGTFKQLKLSEDEVSITTPINLGKFSTVIDSETSAALNIGELQNIDVTFTILDAEMTVRFLGALSVFQRD